MIVLDTTVLAYAVGGEHPLREPCAHLIRTVADGVVNATTTAEVIQEFTHVYSRRRERRLAARLAKRYTEGFAPLLTIDADMLKAGLSLYARQDRLDAFDAVLAATALARGAVALVSADRAFEAVPRLRFVDIGAPSAVEQLQAM